MLGWKFVAASAFLLCLLLHFYKGPINEWGARLALGMLGSDSAILPTVHQFTNVISFHLQTLILIFLVTQCYYSHALFYSCSLILLSSLISIGKLIYREPAPLWVNARIREAVGGGCALHFSAPCLLAAILAYIPAMVKQHRHR